MPPDKNQNINLLPSDLERKRQIIKQVIAGAPKEYTQAQNGQPKKVSFWAKLFSAKPKKAKPANGGVNLPLKPKLKPLVIEEALLSSPAAPPPKSNFLNATEFAHKEAPKARSTAAPRLKKSFFWSKFFKPARNVSHPPANAVALRAGNDADGAKLKLKPEAIAESKVPAKEIPFDAPKPNFLTANNFKQSDVPKDEPKSAPLPPSAPKAIEMTEVANGVNHAEAGENFGVNLLSAEYASAFAKQNQNFFFLYSVGAATALVIIVYLGLHLYQMQKAGQVARSQQANEELTTAINTFNDLDKEDQQLGKKVAAVKDLLAAHISTRAFLEKLESVIIPEVTFKALAATQDGGVTVSARAASYTALARQLTVLQETVPWIKEVVMASAGAVSGNLGEDEGVEFDMVLRVDPVIFKANQAK